MYQIAIYDSENTELDSLERILRGGSSPLAENEFRLERFTNTKDLLWKAETESCQPDIILLDISGAEETGIETARKLRGMGYNGKIILLASSADYALAAFEVEAVSYLLKPVSEEALFRALDKILKHMRDDRHQYVLLKTSNRIRRFALGDIIYCEAQAKKQYVHLSGEEHVLLRTTLSQLWQAFCSHKEFVKIGASYIVNLDHVRDWDKQKLLLDNGQEIYLPRGAYQSLPSR